MAKSDALEKESRVLEVVRMKIHGARRFDIIQHGTKKWKVCVRTIDEYIAEAVKVLKETSKDKLDLNEEFGLAVMQLSDLYTKAEKAGEYNTARMIRKDLSTLTGIDEMKIIISTETMDTHTVMQQIAKILGQNAPD